MYHSKRENNAFTDYASYGIESEIRRIIMAKQYSVTVNGTVYDVTVEEVGEAAVAAPVSAPKAAVAVPVAAPKAAVSAPAGAGEPVKAPLNGTVLKINVENGAAVKAGDVLCVLEAMKMENDIAAPRDGKITSVVAQKGSTVNSGDVLFTLA